MVNLSKYPTNGHISFVNIFEQLANGIVQSVIVNAHYAARHEWELGMIVMETDNDGMQLQPFIGYQNEWGNTNCQLRYYIGIKNSNKSVETKQMLIPGEIVIGPTLKFLDLQPEILDNGALVIEYGWRVEAVQKENGVWNYPMWTGFVDSNGDELMMQVWENNRTRFHKQMNDLHRIRSNGTEYYPAFHSQYIALQIAHGVHFQYSPNEYPNIARDACVLELRTVIQYCQWKLIQMEHDINPPMLHICAKFGMASICGMRSYLVYLIREMASKEELMKILQYMNVDEMSGETMKTFVKFLAFE